MKKKRLLFLIFVAVLLASFAYMSLTDHSKISAADKGAIPALFSEAAVSGQPDRTNDRTIIRQRHITINLGLLMKADGSPKPDSKGLTVSLNLFDDVALTAVIDKTESVSPGSYSFIGRVAGIEQSSVILSVYDSIMSGSITLPGASYQVRYVSGGVHAAYQIDPSAYPREAPPIPIYPTGKDSSQNSIPAGRDSGSTIDILVAYTSAARSAQGGTSAMQSLINLAVSETNTGYSQSQVNQRVRLVHTTEVSYTESSDTDAGWSTDLSRLRSTSDGYMDNIHTLRDQYGADLVVLIIAKGYYCGLGYMMASLSGTFESYAFSMISRSCVAGPQYSFAHEMGHNMGSNHDHANASDVRAADVNAVGDQVYPYSFGYQAPSKAFRTIMAYPCSGTSCPRINYWSNPGLQWVATGELLGVAGEGPTAADNHRSLNNTAFTVANFRQQTTATTTSTTSTTSTTTIDPFNIGGGGGCFIATAAYGSYLDPHVVVLRDFRDRYLQTNRPGQYFIAWYYHNSPPVADLIRNNEPLKMMTRALLAPVILAIQYPALFVSLVILLSLAMIVFVAKRERQGYRHRKAVI
jgi:hypothetical protein